VAGTVYFSTDVVFTDVFVETKCNTVVSGSALMFDTLIFETFTFTIGTVETGLGIGDEITTGMTLAFDVYAFTLVFSTFLEDIKGDIWWTVTVVSTLDGSAFVVLTTFVFTTGVVTDAVNLFTFVFLGITGVEFTVDIEWFAVFVGTAFNSFTFVLETDLLVATEFTSSAFNFDTLWVSVVGFSVTNFSFLEVWAFDRVTWVTVGLLFTVDWLTSVGTFLDLIGTFIIGDDYTVGETFVWCVVTVAVIMGVTFLFNTFVIVAIVLVWAVFRLDTLLWLTDVLLAKTFTILAIWIGVEFASSMRSTINLFAVVLSWVFFVNLFTEMIFTAISIVFAVNCFT